MPKINIREVDTSSTGVLETTTNVAYVPGYALTGPVETPTLCETLADFQRIFGSVPYKYSLPHTSTTIMSGTQAGQYETSYIFASDLLRLGLPILFERVKSKEYGTGQQAFKWIASSTVDYTQTGEETAPKAIDIVSANPGPLAANIKYWLEGKEVKIGTDPTSGNDVNKMGYTITVFCDVNEEYGTKQTEKISTTFTLSPELNEVYPEYLLAGTFSTDKSGLISLTFTSDETHTVIADTGTASSPIQLAFKNAPDTLPDAFTPDYLYTNYFSAPTSIFEKLEDKGLYTIKFITSGGYPTAGSVSTYSVASEMLRVACTRGDCTALVDCQESLSCSASHKLVTALASNATIINSETSSNYGASFTPWCTFRSPSIKRDIKLSPSFAYLSAYAVSTQSNANWYAAAGVTRGYIPNLIGTDEAISESLSQQLQPRDGVAINPIMEIRPYGTVIWGNRTLKNNIGDLTVTSFLNVRQLANDVKRTVWVACKTCTFEPNSNILWINFKAQIVPLLEQMTGNNGLSGYKITRLPTDKKATVVARITLYCIEAVEDFDITVELTDSQITITQ